MRLINTVTFEMHEFFDAQIPEYAVLSHRWESKEVSHRDFLRHRLEIASSDNKIQRFCTLSRETYSCDWAWVDTCCIDKTSSAELSEAINSMFRWYADAKICVAYLSDVDTSANLTNSVWFTRGWTLQELLAPVKVDFYNASWNPLGTRTDLAEPISTVTGIRTSLLEYFRRTHETSRHTELESACIAEKMSWASKRVTSRKEDMAYCLMGLFDVNMPLLYGEGDKAFYRLQQEIIKDSDDESIFAWSAKDDSPRGFFATSPRDFHTPTIRRLSLWGNDQSGLSSKRPYQITNRGLQFQANVLHFPTWKNKPNTEIFGIPIRCCSTTTGASSQRPLILPVSFTSEGYEDEVRFVRRGDLTEFNEEQWVQLLQENNDDSNSSSHTPPGDNHIQSSPALFIHPLHDVYLILRINSVPPRHAEMDIRSHFDFES